NLLSSEKVTVDDRLFSTLSTTTRKLLAYKLPVLITDTVGFIQSLPAWVIDAFHSTLEEIENADVVLLVCDVSDELDTLVMKLQTSLNELMELGVTSPIIIVLNKIDSISKEELKNKIDYIKNLNVSRYRKIIPISVKTGENIDLLLETIYDLLPQLSHLSLTLPNTSSVQSFISWLYERANVLSISYDKDISIDVECNSKLKNKIISTCKKLKGSYILKDS
ncbi:MAG TPA: HflX family GTPase, partial [Thermoplasmatales archaeon]|nr:HflX family GTPase [Thermoplasmatales archaeon]